MMQIYAPMFRTAALSNYLFSVNTEYIWMILEHIVRILQVAVCLYEPLTLPWRNVGSYSFDHEGGTAL